MNTRSLNIKKILLALAFITLPLPTITEANSSGTNQNPNILPTEISLTPRQYLAEASRHNNISAEPKIDLLPVPEGMKTETARLLDVDSAVNLFNIFLMIGFGIFALVCVIVVLQIIKIIRLLCTAEKKSEPQPTISRISPTTLPSPEPHNSSLSN